MNYEFLRKKVLEALNSHKIRKLIEDEIQRVLVDKLYDLDIAEVVAELYPENYYDFGGEDAFIVKPRHSAEPDFDYIIKILSERLNVPEEEIDRICEKYKFDIARIYEDVIDEITNELSKEIKYPVYRYERWGEYWGIPLDKIKLEPKILKRDIEDLRKKFIEENLDEIVEHVSEEDDPTGYLTDINFELYISDLAGTWIDTLIYERQIDLSKFVKFKDNILEIFMLRVEATALRWANQRLWADIYEDYIKDWLKEEGILA